MHCILTRNDSSTSILIGSVIGSLVINVSLLVSCSDFSCSDFSSFFSFSICIVKVWLWFLKRWSSSLVFDLSNLFLMSSFFGFSSSTLLIYSSDLWVRFITWEFASSFSDRFGLNFLLRPWFSCSNLWMDYFISFEFFICASCFWLWSFGQQIYSSFSNNSSPDIFMRIIYFLLLLACLCSNF